MPTFLMTGSSRGLGLHAARRMLDERRDLRLIVVARSAHPDLPRTTVLRGDMASLESVREVAAAIDQPLDGYVGNAGVQMRTDTTTTVDGFETTFAVNVLANFLLIRSLPFADGARVVLTGSDSHFGTFRHNMGMVPAPRWTAAHRLAEPGALGSGRRAYSTSKLAVVYLVHAVARRMPVDAYTFNPAFTPGTSLVRDDPVGDIFFRRIAPHFPRVNTSERAGAQLAAVAVGPRPGPSGAYIDRWTLTPSSPESYDESREDELWATAERLTSRAARGAGAQ